LVITATSSDGLGHGGQTMIVMIRHEQGQIQQSHGRVQAWMDGSPYICGGPGNSLMQPAPKHMQGAALHE